MSTALQLVPVFEPPATLPERPDVAALRAELDRLLASAADGEATLLPVLRGWLDTQQSNLRARFEAGGHPEIVIYGQAAIIDVLVQSLLDYALARIYRLANPTAGERLAVLAVGGYGRGELAPHSDVDLLFLHPYKRTPHGEQMIEFLLYRLWDLGLKVGHATRSVSECLRLARSDVSIRTTLLEARLVWGDRMIFDELLTSFRKEVIEGAGPAFVEAKLAERAARHQRTGGSRYLLEPNIKEGKGGLRDLHTLFWLGRFLYRIENPEELVDHGVLTGQTLRTFLKARRFLWAVRCHLHYLTGRAEERLTFDVQPEIARRMGYRDRKTSRAVERFMKRYYLVAKEVGSLTRIVCAALEEQHRRRPRFALARLGGLRRRRIDGMVIQGGRIMPAEPDLFVREPVAMLRLFQLAQERGLDIHPEALRAIAQSLRRIDQTVREDPAANALFLAMLTSRKDPATTLRRMNEAGVLGRFVPEFGRIVAQMEHSLYHVYTVDEHTIQAIGVLHQIETGQLADELPLATSLMPKVLSRTELYVALFFHDLGKGRSADHAEIGAQLAAQAGPRLGLSQEQTETVVWLVRNHLLLSRIAFKRDIEDPKTVSDAVERIQSPERLRLLLVLTAADIRAVGNVWNGWKGQLLRELYHETEAALAGGDRSGRRQLRIDAAKDALAAALRHWPEKEVATFIARQDPRYWLSFDLGVHRRHAELVRAADAAGGKLTLDFEVDRFRARTDLTLYAPDHAGLFMKVAGALALSGASIVDARIFTTADGMALDSFGFQNAEESSAVDDPQRLERIRRNVERALAGEVDLEKALAGRRSLPQRTDAIVVEPRVLIDNAASRTHTLIEVNGRDRPGLLYAVAKVLKDHGLVISSAHISTFGERVVDVFYVKDVFGLKITQPSKLRQIQRQLTAALADEEPAGAGERAEREGVAAGG